MNPISYKISNKNGDIFENNPCECCPYGFHIDTDFVRYCDALLSTFYDKHSVKTRTNHHSYQTIEKNFKFDEYIGDNLITDTDSIYSYKNRNSLEENKNYISTSPDVYNHHLDNDDLSNSIESVDKYGLNRISEEETNDNNKNVDLLLLSNTNGTSVKSQEEFPPLSPTASSCISSTVSKSVLTQIRNHLALSLFRVKELESQVSQISLLKDEISKLETERKTLLEKLNETKTINGKNNFEESSLESYGNTENFQSSKLKQISTMSIVKCDSWSVTVPEKCFRNIGTLTNFAPCVIFRNAFVQTDLKSKDIKKDIDVKESMTMTEHLSRVDDDFQIYHEKGSQTEHSHLKTMIVDIYDANKTNQNNDKIPYNDNNYNNQKVPLDGDSINLTSVTNKSINSPTPASSTQSIRLCEKCNEMIASNSLDYVSLPENITNISLPKIIKSDSGISVERRQIDNKIIEENDNVILVYPSTEFENIPLSDESECSSSRDYFKNQNKKSFTTSNEVKAALKIINDNLFLQEKSFLFSKGVAVVKKNWFKISSSVDSDYRAVESYLDFIEKISPKLLDFIVNLSDTNGNTAIHYAISYNNFDIVSILLDSKFCDVNKYNKAGYTATMLVSLAKIENELYRDIVERLFNQADVNLKAKQNGQTALMLAASHGRVEISKILLDCGAEVNLQDNDGSTALMCAAEHGHLEVISLLLSQYDCDPLIEDNEGSTALKIALVNGHNDIGVLLYAGTRNFNGHNFLNRSLTNSNKRSGSFTYSSSNFHVPNMVPYRNSPPKLRRSSFSTSSPLKN